MATSGPALVELLKEAGYQVIYTKIIPDEFDQIAQELRHCSDELKVCLALTTGGTGFSPRDITPEATLSVIERETRGIPEAMRAFSMTITDKACLSREAAGIRGETLIVNLPGSRKASTENLSAVLKPPSATVTRWKAFSQTAHCRLFPAAIMASTAGRK